MTRPADTHTPGPWHVDADAWVVSNSVGLNRSGARVARLQTKTFNPMPPNEIGANARLIAAAPDLLEACRRAQAAIEAVDAAWESGDLAGAVNDLPDLSAVIDAAVSAEARA